MRSTRRPLGGSLRGHSGDHLLLVVGRGSEQGLYFLQTLRRLRRRNHAPQRLGFFLQGLFLLVAC
jgi:hypothetical protein